MSLMAFFLLYTAFTSMFRTTWCFYTTNMPLLANNQRQMSHIDRVLLLHRNTSLTKFCCGTMFGKLAMPFQLFRTVQ